MEKGFIWDISLDNVLSYFTAGKVVFIPDYEAYHHSFTVRWRARNKEVASSPPTLIISRKRASPSALDAIQKKPSSLKTLTSPSQNVEKGFFTSLMSVNLKKNPSICHLYRPSSETRGRPTIRASYTIAIGTARFEKVQLLRKPEGFVLPCGRLCTFCELKKGTFVPNYVCTLIDDCRLKFVHSQLVLFILFYV